MRGMRHIFPHDSVGEVIAVVIDSAPPDNKSAYFVRSDGVVRVKLGLLIGKSVPVQDVEDPLDKSSVRTLWIKLFDTPSTSVLCAQLSDCDKWETPMSVWVGCADGSLRGCCFGKPSCTGAKEWSAIVDGGDKSHTAGVSCLAIVRHDHDSQLPTAPQHILLSGSMDCKIVVWGVHFVDKEDPFACLVALCQLHGGSSISCIVPVFPLDITIDPGNSYDASLFVVARKNGAVEMWSASTAATMDAGRGGEPSPLKASPLKVIARGNRNSSRIFSLAVDLRDLRDGTPPSGVRGTVPPCVVVAGLYQKVAVYNGSGGLSEQLTGHATRVQRVAFLKQNSGKPGNLLSSSRDGVICKWNIRGADCVQSSKERAMRRANFVDYATTWAPWFVITFQLMVRACVLALAGRSHTRHTRIAVGLRAQSFPMSDRFPWDASARPFQYGFSALYWSLDFSFGLYWFSVQFWTSFALVIVTACLVTVVRKFVFDTIDEEGSRDADEDFRSRLRHACWAVVYATLSPLYLPVARTFLYGIICIPHPDDVSASVWYRAWEPDRVRNECNGSEQLPYSVVGYIGISLVTLLMMRLVSCRFDVRAVVSIFKCTNTGYGYRQDCFMGSLTRQPAGWIVDFVIVLGNIAMSILTVKCTDRLLLAMIYVCIATVFVVATWLNPLYLTEHEERPGKPAEDATSRCVKLLRVAHAQLDGPFRANVWVRDLPGSVRGGSFGRIFFRGCAVFVATRSHV